MKKDALDAALSAMAVITGIRIDNDGGAKVTLDLSSEDAFLIVKLANHKMQTTGLVEVSFKLPE